MGSSFPLLDSSEAAMFDADTIGAELDVLILLFPAEATDLPAKSRFTVMPRQRAAQGDLVAVATCDGTTCAGFYQCENDQAAIISFSQQERLRWNVADESRFIRWIFPVSQVAFSCICQSPPAQTE